MTSCSINRRCLQQGDGRRGRDGARIGTLRNVQEARWRIISFFGADVGGLNVQGRQFPIQRFQLPAIPEDVAQHNIDGEVLVRVEKLARAEMDLSRKCILVFVKGKADAEILAKKLERLEWVLYACHAESEEDMVNQILSLPPDAEGYVIVGTSFVETAVTVPAICTVICSCRVNGSIVDAEGVSTNQARWCSKLEIENQSGRAGRTSPGKVLCPHPTLRLTTTGLATTHQMLDFDKQGWQRPSVDIGMIRTFLIP